MPDQPQRTALPRRLLLLAVAPLPAAAPPAAAQVKGKAGVTDNDPNDQAGHGRGDSRPQARQPTSDSDPRDRAGRGRPRTGQSDSDPNDRPGFGGYPYR